MKLNDEYREEFTVPECVACQSKFDEYYANTEASKKSALPAIEAIQSVLTAKFGVNPVTMILNNALEDIHSI